jgi:hypothetical protein
MKWNIKWMQLNTQIRILMNIKENIYIYIYEEVLTFLGQFTALRSTATDAPLAARRIQILPMNQNACGQ